MKNPTTGSGRTLFFTIFLVLVLASAPSRAEEAPDLTSLDIEELMDLTVTSVSRKEERLFNAPAAIHIVTAEDIRRSGVTNIPDALRMVPGLQVARIDGNKWAVSSRGFNSRLAAKMLVLVDGRSVYTPLFSGVFWDAQDTLLEDIDRIEVIRGPGATMWGANAVNGIINIITKSSVDTRRGLVTAGGGDLERFFAGARYGMDTGTTSSARVYLKYFERGGLDRLDNDRQGHNGWKSLRTGFRYDADPVADTALTLQGDYFTQWMEETYIDSVSGSRADLITPVSGGNLLGRWTRSFSDTSEMALQLYYDRSEVDYQTVIAEKRDTVDIDFQNRFRLCSHHDIVWGAGYRFIHDRLNFPTDEPSITPTSKDTDLLSAFVQDSITLVPERLQFIVGSKFEHNDYTGFELQPNARLLWTPTEKTTVWMSVSRALRTPTRAEDTMSITLPGPVVTTPFFPEPLATRLILLGSRSLKAEEVIAYEAGYRHEPVPGFILDAAVFYNFHRRLNIYRPGVPVPDLDAPQPFVTIPLQLGNFGRTETAGAELAADLRVQPWWRIKGAYTWLQEVESESSPGAMPVDIEGENPRHQLSLRSQMDVTRNVDLDLWLRYVDELEAFDIGSYVTLDARVAWRPCKGVELSLVGQNLLQDRHREFMPQFINTEPAAVVRSVYAKVTWEF